jgi:hypothetical protein
MMALTRCCRLGLALIIAMALGSMGMGQTETATISGLVTDEGGGTVPNCEVQLQSLERGTVTTVRTNDAGIYVFASVQPGQYNLTLRRSGFKQLDLLSMIVNVQDHIQQNFRLQVGSVSESVTVTAESYAMNTTDASVSTVVDRNFAENLPMNGRSFQTLIQLTPGVVVTPSNLNDAGQFSVNGQRADSNYWMVDGVSANFGIGINLQGSPSNGLSGSLGSSSAMGGTNSLVSVDALQEFRIQTSTFAPEFGRTPGGQISIVTRSGTSPFHGTAFEYLRNDALDANNWFNGYTNNPPLPKAMERQNDFGGAFSGPVFKDRTFFFFSYEGLRLRLPQTALTTVPDRSARQNAISAMQPYLNAFPLPNGSEDPVNAGAAQFNASYSNPATLDATSLRIDQKFGDRLTLFGRYNFSPSNIVARGSYAALSVLSTSNSNTQTATIGATWTPSPMIANDVRFNYSQAAASNSSKLDNFGGAVPLASLPFPSPFEQGGNLNLIIFSLQYPHFNIVAGNQGRNEMRQFNIVDGLSLHRGSHALKLGIDFRRLSPFIAKVPYIQEPFFSDIPSAQSGNSLGAVLGTNIPSTFLLRNLGMYAQDTWRATRRLTLTYGVRWDIDFVPQSINGPNFAAVTGFNLDNPSGLALAPVGTAPYSTGYGNFAPRIGAAYQLSNSQQWQTVLRGGFGIFYDLASSEAGNCESNGFYPFGTVVSSPGGTYPLAPSMALPPSPPPPGSLNICAFDPNLKSPYTLEWNVALEQALGTHQTVSASYVGAAGKRLLQTEGVNTPNANLLYAELISNAGTSDYHALQVQFQRRLSRGLQVLASYTWSHSIDTGSAGSTGLSSNLVAPGGNQNINRGPSSFDIRNAFSSGITYDVPVPSANTFVKVILGGWSTQNIIQAFSAPPVDISDSSLAQLNGSGQVIDVRPDLVPGQPLYLYGRQYPGGKAFNSNAFTNPPIDPSTGFPLRQGNAPRNFLRGFGATQWDFAVHREFPIHESFRLQFRAEVFNVLNHPNFGQPSGAWGGGGFGISTQTLNQFLNGGSTGVNNLGSGAFNPLYQIGGPRSIQLALKLMF